MSSDSPTCIDLFSGCGGFTLGMMRAGYRVLAAIDLDPTAINTLRNNLAENPPSGLMPVENTLKRNLSTFHPEQLAEIIGTTRVDVIVGGPPCQGFSTARQVDGANHGKRLKDDPRRHLYRHFLRYVDFFQPKLFVIENVLGIRTAAGGKYFTQMQKKARALGTNAGKPGYRVHSQVENAWELGVPQKRRRQLIIGLRSDLPGYFSSNLKPAPRTAPDATLGIAIGDLPILRAGSGENERDYDLIRRAKHFKKQGSGARKYLDEVLEVQFAKHLTNHVSRFHSDRDLRDFALLREGENSAVAMKNRGVVFEFPYKKDQFKDRYTRQSHSQVCSTIVAHLSKDGLMFIHPTQNRSLTPREAARVQSFPDWFRFPEARTDAFRMIGNAVPPLIGESLGIAAKAFLGSASTLLSANLVSLPNLLNAQVASTDKQTRHQNALLPDSDVEAVRDLERLARFDRKALRSLPKEDFLRAWHALLFLFPSLHPNNARDHGDSILIAPQRQSLARDVGNRMNRRYARSGWPVILEPIGREAWRRFDSSEVTGDAFYCVEAQIAGLTAIGQAQIQRLGTQANLR